MVFGEGGGGDVEEIPQGLKTAVILPFFGTTEQLAEKSLFSGKTCENIPQWLKPPLILLALCRD
jgi:hypothetical protein